MQCLKVVYGNKAGLTKYKTDRINFKTIFIGNYEAKHLKSFGLNNIIITPKNGMTCERIKEILADEKTEIKNGYVVLS